MKSKSLICVSVLVSYCLMPCAAPADISILSGLSQEFVVMPGEIHEGVIIIKNTGEEPTEIKLYQRDYRFFFNGTNTYGDPGEQERSNARWISFSPQRLILPPKTTSRVTFVVQVPHENLLPGTYWSMIMVEEIPESSPESIRAEKAKVTMGIKQLIRYGIQIVTQIGNSGVGELKFLNSSLQWQGDNRVLQIDIENIGSRWLRPVFWVELYGSNGNFVGKFEGGQFRIYPTTSVRYWVDLTEVPDGTYKALAVADCGGDEVFGVNYTLKFGE